MKILLTGITGFLGSHLAAALLRQKHEVIGLKRSRSDSYRLNALRDRIRFFDVERGTDAIFETHPDISLVIHAATAYGYDQEPVSDVIASNVVMPLKLLEWVVTQKTCSFINTDTFFCKASDTYGHLSSYIVSKKLFLQLAEKLADTHGATFCNMRIEHMFGPNDGTRKFTTNMLRQLLDNAPEIKLTPGQQVRDFVFVDDVVDAYMTVVCAIEENALKGKREFEVGSGMPHTVMDFVTMAHRITGSTSRLEFGSLAYRESEIMYSLANLDALKALGWKPKVELEAGIGVLAQSMR